MNIFSFTSLFKKKPIVLKLPDSLLIKKLKKICKNNSLSIYENLTIYHHTKSFSIPLLILDKTRGIYLFEYKEWSYNDLKNATISKATNQNSSDKNLAFDKTHDFIKQKFNELTHSDGVPIHNYLLMQNIDKNEYQHLDESFKSLLPEQKVIFNDSPEDEILVKLKNVPPIDSPLLEEVDIIGNLLIQYLIFSKNNTIYLATKEQREFIDSKINSLQILNAKSYSGKTNSILLKAILENLKNSDLKIIIIEPTRLACDMLKQKLLQIIEYGIIEIDLASIEIITPIDLINKHLAKLKKPQLEMVLHIENNLMKKNFKVADLIICDDSDIIEIEFIDYLKQIQKNSSLILVNETTQEESTFTFNKSFKDKNISIVFKEANQYAKTLQIISSLLKTNKSEDILVVSNAINKRYLMDDLEFFIKDKATALDSSDNLQNQNLENLLLTSYPETSGLSSKFVILLDIEDAPLNEIKYALNLALDTTFILYEEESENIKILKENYA